MNAPSYTEHTPGIAPPLPDSPPVSEFATALELVDTLTNAARVEGQTLAGSPANHLPTMREAFAATDAARHALLAVLLGVRVSCASANGGAL